MYHGNAKITLFLALHRQYFPMKRMKKSSAISTTMELHIYIIDDICNTGKLALWNNKSNDDGL